MPSTFQQAFEQWQTASATFLEAVRTIPDDLQKTAGLCGEWSSKEVIAHLAGWQREALKRYNEFLAGDLTDITYDEDAFNASSVVALKLLSWHEVLQTYQYTCQDLAALAKSLSPEEIEREPRYAQWMGGLAQDHLLHTQQIHDWRTVLEGE